MSDPLPNTLHKFYDQRTVKINYARASATFYFLLLPIAIFCQSNNFTDSIVNTSKAEQKKFHYKQLIIPATLMTYGIIGIESNALKSFNLEINDEITEDIDEKITIDDFSQYAPAAAVYGLNILGVKGRNRLKDRSIIFGTSFLIMSGTVIGLKSITHVERPDNSANNSFPSGHTATAFAGAEFLWQEYKDVSIWYGISGYLVATGTGIFRLYNKKHWLTDVAMGAGIGMLSTKIAYWLYSDIENTIFKSHRNIKSAMIAPYYNGKQTGLGLIINLK